jgi:hypothetical protein
MTDIVPELYKKIESDFNSRMAMDPVIRSFNKRLEAEVVPGDVVQAGVVISNSEVGLGAVSVQPLIYRLVCTNGMICQDFGERRAHVGRQTKGLEDFIVYQEDTKEAEVKAFMLLLRVATMRALGQTRFSQIVDKLQLATSARIIGRVEDIVELTCKTYGLNLGEQDYTLTYLIQGGDLTMYGLSNAITRASQDCDSYDRATTLESLGWDVATMAPAQWREINNVSN